jgi:hypothetical protein
MLPSSIYTTMWIVGGKECGEAQRARGCWGGTRLVKKGEQLGSLSGLSVFQRTQIGKGAT